MVENKYGEIERSLVVGQNVLRRTVMCEFQLFKDRSDSIREYLLMIRGLCQLIKLKMKLEKMQILKISRFGSSIKILFEPLCLGYKYFISLQSRRHGALQLFNV